MTDHPGIVVFTDESRAVWEPLIEAVRPHGRTPPKELRRTMPAVVWRRANGAKRRSVPAKLGPWWLAGLFIRWAEMGVWERLLEQAAGRGIALGMVFLDGTDIRAHQKAAGAQKGVDSKGRGLREALGRSRGGFGAKAGVIADGHGKAVAFALAPGAGARTAARPGFAGMPA